MSLNLPILLKNVNFERESSRCKLCELRSNMKIPPDAVIPEEKLTGYLLVPREYDDKSKFLSQAGFTLEDPEKLIEAIRKVC